MKKIDRQECDERCAVHAPGCDGFCDHYSNHSNGCVNTDNLLRAFVRAFGRAFLRTIPIIISATLFAIPVWILWNWIVLGVLGQPGLTLFQSWGLSTLCGMLFKNFSTSLEVKHNGDSKNG